MSRSITLALLCGATLGASAASAEAASSIKPDCSAKLLRSANHHRHVVVAKHGVDAAGRDIVRQGVIRRNQHASPARCAEVRRYRDQLVVLHTEPRQRLLVRTAVRPYQPPAGVKTASVRASLPDCTWRPESGGNYNAVNPSSGAYGKYQIIPSTWAAHCSGLGRDPSGQEACAARVYAAQGAGAWVGC